MLLSPQRCSRLYPPRAARGFTLVELMIVVVIIGVLAGAASQFYLRYQRRANLERVFAALISAHVLAEQSFQDARSYNAGLCTTNTGKIPQLGSPNGNRLVSLTCTLTADMATATLNTGILITGTTTADFSYIPDLFAGSSGAAGAYVYTIDGNGKRSTRVVAGYSVVDGARDCWATEYNVDSNSPIC